MDEMIKRSCGESRCLPRNPTVLFSQRLYTLLIPFILGLFFRIIGIKNISSFTFNISKL